MSGSVIRRRTHHIKDAFERFAVAMLCPDQLCRYISRSAVSEIRLSLTSIGNIGYRLSVTSAKREKGKQRGDLKEGISPDERRTAMTWAQRLKKCLPRVGALGDIDVGICSRCGGVVKVIACIEEQQVIVKILSYLKKKVGLPLSPDALAEARSPPQTSLLG
ncbi:MAG: hypothetical protein ACI8PP_002642 [Candidatus Pseudothioglobus sp.]|jgi:hypothetical protein